MALVSAGTKRKRVDSKPHPTCYLLQLPKEVLVVICRKIPKEDQLWLAQANKFLYSLFHALVLPPATHRLYTGLDSFTSTLSRLRFALKSPVPPTTDAMLYALEVSLKRNDTRAANVIFRACPGIEERLSSSTAEEVARYGHLDALKWIKKHYYRMSKKVCRAAARAGHLHILQWARNALLPWNEWTCAQAALGGHLPVLEWAHDTGIPLDTGACVVYAASGGHIHVLQWTRRIGCHWNKWTCAIAANAGHLHVLIFLNDNGCRGDTWTCAYAAEGGQLHILQWARQHGCPWDKADILRRSLSPEIRAWVEAQPA